MFKKEDQPKYLSYPFTLCDFPVIVHVCNVSERLPDLFEQGLRDLVLWAIDLPAAHVADLVLCPQEVVVSQAAVVVQIYGNTKRSLSDYRAKP